MFDWTLITIMAQDHQKELEREYARRQHHAVTMIPEPTPLGRVLQRLAALWQGRSSRGVASLRPSASFK